jgi:hypothetical protein
VGDEKVLLRSELGVGNRPVAQESKRGREEERERGRGEERERGEGKRGRDEEMKRWREKERGRDEERKRGRGDERKKRREEERERGREEERARTIVRTKATATLKKTSRCFIMSQATRTHTQTRTGEGSFDSLSTLAKRSRQLPTYSVRKWQINSHIH